MRQTPAIVTNLITSKIKHNYDEQIEQLKGAIAKESTAIQSAIGFLSATQPEVLNKAFRAVEALWTVIENQRIVYGDALFLLNILSPRASCRKLWSAAEEVGDVRTRWAVLLRSFDGLRRRASAAPQVGQNPQIMRRPWQRADRTVPYLLLEISLAARYMGENEVGFSLRSAATDPRSTPGCRTSGGTAPCCARARVPDGRRIRPSADR